MAPLKNLKGTLTPAEFKTLRNAIDQIGIKNPAAVNRQTLPNLPLRDFKKRVLGAVFRKVIPRVAYEEEIAGLIYKWYKAGGQDTQVKFDEVLVDQYLNETSQLISEPPPKKAKTSPTIEEEMSTPGTSASSATQSSSSGLTISSPKPNTDSIVDGLLNYDCMLHIFSYLSFADCLILASTHEYFRMIFRETAYARKRISISDQLDKLDLNMTELNLNRYNEKFALVYLCCCKHLTRLTIDSEYSSSLRITRGLNLQNLPHLTHLTVEGYRPIQVDPDNNIESLRLTDGVVYNGNRRRMRPADLTQFKNLRELQFEYYVGLSDSSAVRLTVGIR